MRHPQVGDLYQRRSAEVLAAHLGPQGGAGGAGVTGKVIPGYAPPEELCHACSATSAAALLTQVP